MQNEKVGGDAVLRDPISRVPLKWRRIRKSWHWVASGLMWMKAYQSETTVLQSDAEQMEKIMTTKMQQRLHSLTNGGEKRRVDFLQKSTK
ncbi:MAG: hypothetical protein V8Q57_09680 [Blautia sp.]